MANSQPETYSCDPCYSSWWTYSHFEAHNCHCHTFRESKNVLRNQCCILSIFGLHSANQIGTPHSNCGTILALNCSWKKTSTFNINWVIAQAKWLAFTCACLEMYWPFAWRGKYYTQINRYMAAWLTIKMVSQVSATLRWKSPQGVAFQAA